jgi:hypothetical protein
MRHNVLTQRCAWCNRIKVGDAWKRERREYHVNYATSVCRACEAGHSTSPTFHKAQVGKFADKAT